MAEFVCYSCKRKVLTGEKFTFTKSGAVHFDCFISARRKEVPEEKQEFLRKLSLLLDSQLRLLIDILEIRKGQPEVEAVIAAYKNIEKECGETTRQILAL